jgi:SsrA-binding protein
MVQITNRQARHDYEVLERLEAGLVLQGTEIKSIRRGQANLRDSYVLPRGGELFVHHMHIAPYLQGNRYNPEPTRPRKLLMHKQQIRRLTEKSQEKGLAIIPLAVYFKKGRAKMEICLARGRRQHDRREDIKKRDQEREMRGKTKER